MSSWFANSSARRFSQSAFENFKVLELCPQMDSGKYAKIDNQTSADTLETSASYEDSSHYLFNVDVLSKTLQSDFIFRRELIFCFVCG